MFKVVQGQDKIKTKKTAHRKRKRL